jgi:hypothetical protein
MTSTIWSALFLALSGMALFMLWRDVQKGATSILGFTRPVELAKSPTNFWLSVAIQLLLFGYVFGSSLFELLNTSAAAQ